MPESQQPVVVTHKLTKVFRDFWLREKVTAVADLDLEIYPREVFGLLGPNGSGKSTAIKMILGLLNPTAGRVSIFGRPPSDVAVKRRIGFLPEESYLYPFLNARETLDFYAKLFQYPRAERRRRIDMLLEMVGLASVAYRRVGEYSKGMQRRIGLAQALINDPDLLILDEPTSGMDPIGTKQFKDLMTLLAQRGKTVIVSSHLLAEVEDICDRVSMLYGGRQRKVGSLEDLLGRSDRTQLVTEPLDEAALAKLRQALAEQGRELLEVSRPRTRLESLFMNIVNEAQAQRVSTGGATAGGQVAEFLSTSSDPGEDVIDRLVQTTDEQAGRAAIQPPAGEEPIPAEKPAPRREVLQDLIAHAGPVEAPTQPAEEEPQGQAARSDEPKDDDRPAGKPGPQQPSQAPKRQGGSVDRDFLDGLMGSEDDEDAS